MNPNTYTDDQLIAMIRSGDDTQRMVALKNIWLSGIEAARNRLLKQGGKSYDVDDAMTEAIIVLDNHLRNGKYQQNASLKSYFVGICYWQWLAMKRPTQRINWTAEPLDFDKEDLLMPDVLMLENDQRELVRKLLAQEGLGEKCRDAMRLFGLSWSIKEIAGHFSTTDGYAQQMVFRCRNKLKALLDKNPTLKQQLKDTLNP